MQTHVRNGFCFGKSPVLSTDKYHIRGCVHVIIFACAACGMTQAAIALPEAAQSAVTATKSIQMASAQSAVAQTMTVQPAAVQSGVIPTQTFQPEAAQSAVVPTTTVQASAAHSSVAQTETVAPLVAQSGVAQTTTVQPPAVAPQTVPAKVTPENPGQEKSASAEPKKTWVTIDQPVKKKIVFIQFDVANVSQIGDINNIYDGLPAALAARMATSNKYLATSSRYSLPKSGETSQQQAMTQIAGETGAQFLIAGLFVNAGNGDGKRHIEVKGLQVFHSCRAGSKTKPMAICGWEPTNHLVAANFLIRISAVQLTA
jgi:cobalamin biosynthesis Mg chelatase CobN